MSGQGAAAHRDLAGAPQLPAVDAEDAARAAAAEEAARAEAAERAARFAAPGVDDPRARALGAPKKSTVHVCTVIRLRSNRVDTSNIQVSTGRSLA